VIEQIDSLNEPNHYTFFANWYEVARDFQAWLAGLRPDFPGRPILGPSPTNDTAAQQIGDLTPWVDMGSMHPYGDNAGFPPGRVLAGEFDRCHIAAPGKPCRVTEVGYHTDLTVTQSGNLPVSEDVRATYTLRMVLDYFRQGIPRTDLYTVVAQSCGDFQADSNGDGEPETSDFGFYSCTWQPHPVAHAMHNLTGAIGNGTPALDPVAMAVEQAPTDLRRLAWRQADGDYVIGLWRDVSVWNRTTRQPIAVTPQDVRLWLPEAASVGVVRPKTSATESPASLANGRVTVSVAGDVVLLVVR
jgi:hypothetical protein